MVSGRVLEKKYWVAGPVRGGGSDEMYDRVFLCGLFTLGYIWVFLVILGYSWVFPGILEYFRVFWCLGQTPLEWEGQERKKWYFLKELPTTNQDSRGITKILGNTQNFEFRINRYQMIFKTELGRIGCKK